MYFRNDSVEYTVIKYIVIFIYWNLIVIIYMLIC
jgi:hypothetical protein